jgi:hypothetical protein
MQGSEGFEPHAQRRHVARPEKDVYRHPHGHVDHERQRHRGIGAAHYDAERDAQGQRERDVRGERGAGLVEPGPGVDGFDRGRHDRRRDEAEERAGRQDCAEDQGELGRQPAAPGRALRPHESLGAHFQVAREQRRADEDADQRRQDNQRERHGRLQRDGVRDRVLVGRHEDQDGGACQGLGSVLPPG